MKQANSIRSANWSRNLFKRLVPKCALLLTFPAFVIGGAANASEIKVTMTVDNSYALLYGTQQSATNFVGSDLSWYQPEVYNFSLDATKYLYVVTASDLSVAQGFLGQFENLTSGYKFYSNDPEWQVAATNLGPNAPYTGSFNDLALLNQQISIANVGNDASGGWTALTAGPSNGGGPWGTIAGIDSAARWVWYSSNGDPDPTTPGFDHDEWLMFRIAVAATPDNPIPSAVPEPSTYVLLAVGFAGLIAFRPSKRSRRQDVILSS